MSVLAAVSGEERDDDGMRATRIGERAGLASIILESIQAEYGPQDSLTLNLQVVRILLEAVIDDARALQA